MFVILHANIQKPGGTLCIMVINIGYRIGDASLDPGWDPWERHESMSSLPSYWEIHTWAGWVL